MYANDTSIIVSGEGQLPYVEEAIRRCCQNPLKCGLGIFWLKMRKFELRLRHLQLYVDEVYVVTERRVSSPSADILYRLDKKETQAGVLELEFRQVLELLSRAGNTSNMSSTTGSYRKLMEFMSDEVLREVLDHNENQLINLFRRTFEPAYLNNNQKPPSLTKFSLDITCSR